MSTATETAQLCSKCKVNQRPGTSETNPWCNECRSKYQKEYMAMIAKRTTEQAFNRGAEAMRKTLAMEFARYGRVMMSGAEIAFAINNAPRPVQIIESEKT